MPTKASEYRRGIQGGVGRKGKGQGATMGAGGDGTTVTPLGRQQGDRDSRSASRMAEEGNRFTKNPSAHGRSYK